MPSTGYRRTIAEDNADAIGNAIRQAYVKEQCMTIQGWNYMKVASSADSPRSLPKGGKVKARGGKADICIRNPSACE